MRILAMPPASSVFFPGVKCIRVLAGPGNCSYRTATTASQVHSPTPTYRHRHPRKPSLVGAGPRQCGSQTLYMPSTRGLPSPSPSPPLRCRRGLLQFCSSRSHAAQVGNNTAVGLARSLGCASEKIELTSPSMRGMQVGDFFLRGALCMCGGGKELRLWLDGREVSTGCGSW
jgi:hypothetical protein